MKSTNCFAISLALLLNACGGFDTKQEFLQDKQNMDKSIELTAKHEKSPDCDKLGKLYEFSNKKSPTTDDLSQILPLLGLSAKDATDIDKILNLNYAKVDSYNCVDNAKKILKESEQYCKDKYYDEYGLETALYFPFRLVSTVSVFTIIGAIPFAMHQCGLESAHHPIACKRKQDCDTYLAETVKQNGTYYGDIDKNALKQRLQSKITGMFPTIPEKAEYLLKEFKASELIKAQQSILGTYDSDYCDEPLCNYDTNVVTKLNAAMVLDEYCFSKTFWPQDENDVNMCICYAHETYNKVTYQNLLYIAEKGELPPSKKTEFNKLRDKCERKIKQQNKNADIARYGETAKENTAMSDFVVETLDNAVWAMKQANEEISKERKRQENNKNK